MSYSEATAFLAIGALIGYVLATIAISKSSRWRDSEILREAHDEFKKAKEIKDKIKSILNEEIIKREEICEACDMAADKINNLRELAAKKIL